MHRIVDNDRHAFHSVERQGAALLSERFEALAGFLLQKQLLAQIGKPDEDGSLSQAAT